MEDKKKNKKEREVWLCRDGVDSSDGDVVCIFTGSKKPVREEDFWTVEDDSSKKESWCLDTWPTYEFKIEYDLNFRFPRRGSCVRVWMVI